MRLRVERDALKAVATRAAHFTAGPPFHGAVLALDGDKLHLYATDADLSCATSVHVSGQVNGRAHVPAKRLASAVSALRQGAVEVEVGVSALLLRCGPSSASVPLLAVNDAPRLQEVPEMAPLAGGPLLDALARVVPAASTDPTREQLVGVYVEPEGERCRFSATDSYRLASTSVETPWAGENAVVPAVALKELVKLATADATVMMGTTGNLIAFGVGETVVTSRLIAGGWLNYRQLIQTNPPYTLTADREELADAVKRVSPNANAGPMRCDLTPDRLELSTKGEDGSTSADAIDVDWSGSEFTVGFNGRFLLDALVAAKGERVTLGMTDHLKPVMIKAEPADEWLTVLMPHRMT